MATESTTEEHRAPARVIIAPDSFKGTISAGDAARAIASGWRSVRPHDEILLRPMADGGEGTLDAFEMAVPGSIRMPVTVQGPDNNPVEPRGCCCPQARSTQAERPSSSSPTPAGSPCSTRCCPSTPTRSASGRRSRPPSTTACTALLLAIGGSSSSDGGVGALAALGAQFIDPTGRPIRLGNRGLGQLARIRFDEMRALPAGGAQILSDVNNPLLGTLGAATVFGPQKGASPEQVEGIESGLQRLARLLPGFAESPGAGAAGGTGFGLLHWGATLTPGASAIGEAMGLADATASASVVITGEGRYDNQSAAGKVPSYLAGLAAASGATALLVAGAIQAPSEQFAAAISLSELAGSSEAAMADPERWLRAAGARLAGSVTGSR